jgi:hypothetical protein
LRVALITISGYRGGRRVNCRWTKWCDGGVTSIEGDERNQRGGLLKIGEEGGGREEGHARRRGTLGGGRRWEEEVTRYPYGVTIVLYGGLKMDSHLPSTFIYDGRIPTRLY